VAVFSGASDDRVQAGAGAVRLKRLEPQAET